MTAQDFIGRLIKGIGVIVAAAAALASWVAIQNLRMDSNVATVAIMIIVGVVFLTFYTVGLLVSTQGQILRRHSM